MPNACCLVHLVSCPGGVKVFTLVLLRVDKSGNLSVLSELSVCRCKKNKTTSQVQPELKQ